ncbi:MAG: bacteriohemerythrin [Gallionella sp.]|nr:bacteriohemerythrin [Gallionella sp.]
MTSYNQSSSIPDKAMFNDFLEKSLAQAKKLKRKLGLLLIDINGHETINGHFGHEAGDSMLVTMAERLRSAIRQSDMVAYFGDDTFAVILIDPVNMASVVLESEWIRESLTAPVHLKAGVKVSIGVSIMIAVYPENSTEFDRLLAVSSRAVSESQTCEQDISANFKELPHEYVDILTWMGLSENHCVGIPDVDEQHKKLEMLINGLHEAIKNTPKNDRQHAGALYDELTAFTELHFNTELRLMNEAGYPQADAHNRAHKFLLDELRNLKKRIIEGNELHAFYFLMDWLVAHIANDDKQMGVFLQSKIKSVQGGSA